MFDCFDNGLFLLTTLYLYFYLGNKKIKFCLLLRKVNAHRKFKISTFFFLRVSIFPFLSPSQLYLYFWTLFQDFYQDSLFSHHKNSLLYNPSIPLTWPSRPLKETVSLNCPTLRTDFWGSLNFSTYLVSRRVYFHC